MSRLIVKNLPQYVTPARLKDHFLQKGSPGVTLTDVKVVQKSDGTSRRFAFIGFQREDEAKKAQQWFDRTFIDTTRISVQLAEKGVKDAPKPRPNKKSRLEAKAAEPQDESSTRTKKTKQSNEAVTKAAATLGPSMSKGKKDAEFKEFMQVMQPRTKKTRTWANEDDPIAGPSTQPAQGSSEGVQAPSEEEAGGNAEDLDDLEWLKRRMQKGIQSPEQGKIFEQDEDVESSEQGNKEQEDKNETGGAPTDIVLRTGRLFVRNLSYTCTQSDLESHFLKYGSIKQVHIPLDPVSKSSKGLAYITFQDPACAVKAFEELDKTPFQGRLLHILPAAERNDSGVKGVEEGGGKSSVKAEREKKRKANAGKEFNWSMLYMNADAVASSIADRMNIPKANILNPETNEDDHTSAAVKLALAETHIIQETKAYLESEGIDLSAFSTLDSTDRAVRARRSDTSILVKNIPYGTTSSQIRELFEPYGELTRVLVPPAGTIAVVEFLHSDEATKSFRSVAYRRLGSLVIYLEKAPVNIFNRTQRATEESKSIKLGPASLKPLDENEGSNDTVAETPSGSTLFVKNLSFTTTSERLIAVFQHLPDFAFARIQTKPDPKRPTEPGKPAPRLSMGFGFVGFKSPEAAKRAVRGMQGFVLDGHTLSVKFAGRGTEEDTALESSKVSAEARATTTTKMVVKNVPFEATKKDIRALFIAHGQLKSVRLPKKAAGVGGRTRGFAFLEFTTRHEAENAYAALRHTHLLGRHLVLEWAEDEAEKEKEVERLRMKAGVGYGDGAELPGRKRKLNLREEGEEEDDA